MSIDYIPDPLPGKPILSWALPVTRALNALPDKVGAVARNERNRQARQRPCPYALRFHAGGTDADSCWLIYLPAPDILSCNGSVIDPTAGLNSIDEAWYKLDGIALAGGVVRLNITTTDSGSGESSDITAHFSLDASGTIAIAIGKVSYSEGTATVEQYVTSALHLTAAGGGGSGEDGVGIESIEAGTAYPSDDGEYTKTPITVTLTNGDDTKFDVVAKNGSNAEMSGTVEFIGDMRYDTESHQLQKRVDTLALATGQVTKGSWVMITGGQAVSHSSTITG